MDIKFLEKLVDPISKKELAYDLATEELYDPSSNQRYKIINAIPHLLHSENQELSATNSIHTQTGTPFQYKDHYEKDAEYYNYFATAESKIETAESRRLHQFILNKIPKNAEWILDIGCGGGWLSQSLIPLGKKIISMDISSKNPQKVLANTPHVNHFGLVADVFELPVQENSMDVIVAAEIIEHVIDPKAFIAAILKALKPNGVLIISTPFNEKISYSLCVHCNHPTPANAHLHSFTKEKMESLLPKNIKKSSLSLLNNKFFVKSKLHYFLQFLPFSVFKVIDKSFNFLTRHKAYRLIVVIEK